MPSSLGGRAAARASRGAAPGAGNRSACSKTYDSTQRRAVLWCGVAVGQTLKEQVFGKLEFDKEGGRGEEREHRHEERRRGSTGTRRGGEGAQLRGEEEGEHRHEDGGGRGRAARARAQPAALPSWVPASA